MATAFTKPKLIRKESAADFETIPKSEMTITLISLLVKENS